ncbi:MAG: class I SAM-dependent methyltransferase [Anaerohalosphaeraceae bacterium]|nr:class I SAM-dependent methyltransferase [Anaerohalosphaeraceae bacterium]
MKRPLLLGKKFCGNETHTFSSPDVAVKVRQNILDGKNRNLEYLLKKRFSWMNSYIEPDHKGLELGCGMGLLKWYINASNLILTDVEQHPWVNKKVDALDMCFDNSSMDYIVSSNMIHHIAQPHRFFAECSRVLKDRGKLIIQDVNASFLLRLMMNILNHESYCYDVDVFDRDSICNDPADPWSSNNAVPNMLFDNIEKFENKFPFRIIHNHYAECLVWPLSGGIAGFAKTTWIPTIILKIANKLDQLLIMVSKNTFALQRQIVLENVKQG